MEAKLRKAIELDQLVVHYQPKVSAADGRIVGMEALLRFDDPQTGLVFPKNFIHLLEETGLIFEVGFWVMRRVMEDLRHWRQLNLNPPRVAVNVSPIQLAQKTFLNVLRETLQDTGGRSDGLDIEITESAVMTEVRQNIPKLEAVREMGFQIAIDDFGTGYSSLSYLSRLPINSLKIDRSFIVDMTRHPNSLAIVTSIITLAHSLELEVVAEGVELKEQAKLLKLLRCELIQGNLYSRPLPAERIIPLLRQGHA
jgi:EAL domain-containing protein (putative c-di-GMP-specific phosphodiesterase class I)